MHDLPLSPLLDCPFLHSPHVTLVSGTNGSGKSAVMQGLQASLGVSARNTGRATSLAQFIRTGRNEARVQVTLCNTGPDAFEPDK